MRDRIRATPPPDFPPPLGAVLGATADRLAAMNPATAMSPDALRTEVQLSVWDWHGVYNTAAVGRDITTTLAAAAELPIAGTRAQYADRLRQRFQPTVRG
ncbi:hypothetical protein ACFXCZ_27215 [Streptomyces sp. NPDC059396]|uniref:hypothetical protein n=1 Tax=Streptomyces sp. NPDC059396 TaxID=3346819 RepID=UPI0036A7DD50